MVNKTFIRYSLIQRFLILCTVIIYIYTLLWRHNEHNGVSNHQSPHCLLNRLSRPKSQKISKLCVTGLCEGNSPVTDELPAQRASDAENASIWLRHHELYGMWHLTLWGLNKMSDRLLTTFLNTLSWIWIIVFWFQFHPSLFPRVWLIMTQYCFM